MVLLWVLGLRGKIQRDVEVMSASNSDAALLTAFGEGRAGRELPLSTHSTETSCSAEIPSCISRFKPPSSQGALGRVLVAPLVFLVMPKQLLRRAPRSRGLRLGHGQTRMECWRGGVGNRGRSPGEPSARWQPAAAGKSTLPPKRVLDGELNLDAVAW